MNAPAFTPTNRQAVELDQFDHLLLLMNSPAARSLVATGDFWSSELGAQIIDAMQDFTGCDDLERIAENIRIELPVHSCEEDSDPYFCGRIAPFARALGGVNG